MNAENFTAKCEGVGFVWCFALHVLCGYSGVALSWHLKWELFHWSQQRPPGRMLDDCISAAPIPSATGMGGKWPVVVALQREINLAVGFDQVSALLLSCQTGSLK